MNYDNEITTVIYCYFVDQLDSFLARKSSRQNYVKIFTELTKTGSAKLWGLI